MLGNAVYTNIFIIVHIKLGTQGLIIPCSILWLKLIVGNWIPGTWPRFSHLGCLTAFLSQTSPNDKDQDWKCPSALMTLEWSKMCFIYKSSSGNLYSSCFWLSIVSHVHSLESLFWPVWVFLLKINVIMGCWEGSVGKDTLHQASWPETHMVEGKTQLMQVVICPLRTLRHGRACFPIHF